MVIVPPLVGASVCLEPLEESHRESLRPVAEDERIWTNTLTRAMGPDFDAWFDDALATRDKGCRFPFVVRSNADGQLLGSTSYLDIYLNHRRIEIGSTWYHPSCWGTVVNPDCKYRLLKHAFEVLNVNRVALVTDARNRRSQAAIAKLGAIREGVLRSHMITQNERVRDSVVFSILAAEWPGVREGLMTRILDR